MKLLLIFASLALSGCSGLFYYPTNNVYVDPDKLETAPRDVQFTSGENKIHAWYFHSRSKPKAIVVMFHGNAENRSSHFAALYWMLKEGYDLFVFDYPGYADSTGSSSPQSTVESGEAALRYVKSLNPTLPIVVYGESLGGVIALRASLDTKKQIQPLLIVADSTFLSYKRIAREKLAAHWLTWPLQPLASVLLSDHYAPVNIEQLAPTPILVIHSEVDRVVPYGLGLEIFKAASEPKEMWTLKNSAHISAFLGPEGAETRKKFLAKLDRLLRP